MLEPRIEMLEPPIVHPGLAAFIAFAVPDQQRPAALVDVGLGQGKRF
jgi:hypothetical protein